MADKLVNLTIKGFKSIKCIEDMPLNNINILIGSNGAGKSNFISVFRMLSFALSGKLQEFISSSGGGSSLLFNGAGITREQELSLKICTNQGENDYYWRLVYGGADTLFFADEKYRFSESLRESKAPWKALDAGHKEAEIANRASKTAKVMQRLLRQIKVYQFHNTSFTARMRSRWNLEDDFSLKEDAANLAPFLLRIKNSNLLFYKRIVVAIKNILPFFDDFVLNVETQSNTVLLQWTEINSDVVFNASQAADGMLRVFALLTLLLQPKEQLPNVLILDEPELGLHPYAIHVIAGLIRTVSSSVQVILATQSCTLLDYFSPEDVIIVERNLATGSTFVRHTQDQLADWLTEYSLSELWEKNILGGRP